MPKPLKSQVYSKMRNLALPVDTTVEAARMQMAVWRRLGTDRCLQIAMEMSDDLFPKAYPGVSVLP